MTVTGAVAPDELGPVLMHEHVLCDITAVVPAPRSDEETVFANAPVGLETLSKIRQHPTRNLDNMRLDDRALACEELRHVTAAGGTLLVDPTCRGIGRDARALADISARTGLRIVMGCGYYVAALQPPSLAARGQESIRDEIIAEVTMGVDDAGIRPGIIGEIGCSSPLDATEAKVLRAAAGAQRVTGAALMIHPGRDAKAPIELVRIVERAGGDPTRTILCHLDRTVFDRRTLGALARTGCYLEYDLFGWESSYYPLNPAIDMPSDGQRIDWIRWLFDQGHGENVLVSQDICNKHRLVQYGGHGYGHLLENVIPRLRQKKFGEDEIRALFVENPRRVLTIS